MRVTERFSLVDGATLRYELTVEDPTILTALCTAWYTWARGVGIYEYACHEGNRGLTNVLVSARHSQHDNAEQSSSRDWGESVAVAPHD